MLRLLLCLSALGLLADAASYSTIQDINTQSCSILYYYKPIQSLQVDTVSKTITFKGYSSTSPTEYIGFDKALASDYEVNELTDYTALSQGAQNTLGLASCAVQIKVTLTDGGDAFTYLYADESSNLKVAIETTQNPLVATIIAGTLIDSLTVAASSVESLHMDGCYDTDLNMIFAVNSELAHLRVPSTCTKTMCFGQDVKSEVDICDSNQRCLGNLGCEEFSYCSVMGPTVVDFSSNTARVPGICDYKVLEDVGLTVVGSFELRRLTDTPFLTSLVLTTSDGSVTVNGTRVSDTNGLVAVTDTAKTIAGVSISKDDVGFTMTYTSGDVELSLFFDSTLLHITHGGPSGSVNDAVGLCGTSSGSHKEATSAADCETLTDDAAGDNLDATAVQTKCDEKLSAISSSGIDGFKTACKDLFGSYPDKDGLFCHLLDAFARTSGVSSYRDAAGCAVSGCMARQCASHEFCALSDGGDTICRCKIDDDDLNKFREDGELGGLPTCSENSVSVTLYTCLIEEKGFDPTGLHLTSSDCTGNIDAGEITFTYDSSNLCEGTYETTETAILFKNQILNTGGDGVVSFDDTLSISLDCSYDIKSEIKTASFRIADGSVSIIVETQDFTYTVTFGLFTDDAFQNAVTVDEPLSLNQLVYAEVKTEDVGGDTLALVLDKCFCTPTDNTAADKKYELITDGCAVPTDGTVMILSNGVDLSPTFKFNAFSFVDGSDVYMHCQFKLCVLADGNCAPTCP